ncbi:TetR family transcriptional regulator [Actinocatenispora thailandica]|uniref:TetR family transcriptional regulator n=1 Tax=Actinocatenispora thailandica TaxID=227318 RepID=A0A7R7DPH0_9ACTN|nr:TetR/AcrR family transcriptional regulator [Actinocatenispora thailandica]BCJ35475.1 TetR family transcriptional regulator [Actinocatenispora thailandica]
MTAVRRGSPVPQRLLAAAVELIAEVGWDAVSTRLLADRAGVAPGLVHYHFSSVRALLRGAALAAIDAALADAVGAVRTGSDRAAGLDALAVLLDHLAPDRLAVLFAETLCAAHRDPVLRAALTARLRAFRAALAAWLGDCGDPAPQRTAAVLATAIDGMLVRRAVFGDRFTAGARTELRRLVGRDGCSPGDAPCGPGDAPGQSCTT